MGCNRCQALPCQCVQEPYYVDSPMCAEDHTTKVYVQQMALGLPIQSAWNIPLCGGSAQLSVPGLSAVSVGSYIWHEAYGYYEIIAADLVAKTITVQNNCDSANASPGTQVPPCTTFVVTPVPCCDDQTSGVCVELDFTAPAVDACLDITLSSVEGLIVGSNLQIGSGIYRLNEIKSNNVVNICNDGEGITPGTPVIAKNFAGDYQYCIIQLGVNPCNAEVIAEGKVLACGEGNVQAPLDVPEDKGVLIGFDGTTNEAKFTTPVCGLIINGDDELQVDVSGEWGNASLDYPGIATTGAPIYCDTDGRLRTIPKYEPAMFSINESESTPAWINPGGSGDLTTASSIVIGPFSASARNYQILLLAYAQSNVNIRRDNAGTDEGGTVFCTVTINQSTPVVTTYSNRIEQYVYISAAEAATSPSYWLETQVSRVITATPAQVYTFTATVEYGSLAGGNLDYGNGVSIGVRMAAFVIGVD